MKNFSQKADEIGLCSCFPNFIQKLSEFNSHDIPQLFHHRKGSSFYFQNEENNYVQLCYFQDAPQARSQ